MESSNSSSAASSTPPRRRKRKRINDCIEDVVAELQQALVHSDDVLLVKHLRRLVSLLQFPVASSSPDLDPCAAGVMELLPQLLLHSCSKVGKKTAEAVGLLAIASYEVSCRLAGNQEVMTALAQLLQRAKSASLVNVLIRSILNVATSDMGIVALRKVDGLPPELLRLVSFLAATLTKKVKDRDMEAFGISRTDVGTGGDFVKECALSEVNAGVGHQGRGLDFLVSLPLDETAELLDLALAAVNTTYRDFGSVGLNAGPVVLISLQNLWQSTIRGSSGEILQFPNRGAQLAQLIMRLAMQAEGERYDDASTVDARRLFGNVEHFFQKHWELFPARTTTGFGLSRLCERFAGRFEGPSGMVELLVDAMVACPPAIADELDLFVLYKDMEQELGLLPVLNQDIRLLKCKGGVEIPYSLATGTVSARDCVNAYASGNTVVIRGMQFRWPEIAAICNDLAEELGQVTVGANLYLTPPGSQGLGVHFDDHCVFVCQLRGCKRWTVYPPLELLPRLYSFKTLSTDVKKECATHFDLHAGDLLYIPRGFLHEAQTVSLENGDEAPIQGTFSSNFVSCSECCRDDFRAQNGSGTCNSFDWDGASLHLSFGVEIEPAFDWEGFLHVALRLWSHRNRQPPSLNTTCPSNSSEALLHVAIRNLGTSSHLFRKACILSNPYTKQTPTTGNSANGTECIFRSMLKEVREKADFHSAVGRCHEEEGMEWLRWLRHLPEGGFNADDLEGFTEVVESAFLFIRNSFCEEASFLESAAAHEGLLGKFRRCRQKVMNGLLGLHCGGSSALPHERTVHS